METGVCSADTGETQESPAGGAGKGEQISSEVPDAQGRELHAQRMGRSGGHHDRR